MRILIKQPIIMENEAVSYSWLTWGSNIINTSPIAVKIVNTLEGVTYRDVCFCLWPNFRVFCRVKWTLINGCDPLGRERVRTGDFWPLVFTIKKTKPSIHGELLSWQFCWWPFWDGENVTLSMAVGVLTPISRVVTWVTHLQGKFML